MRLKRALSRWDLILYGVIVIQLTAPMPVFGVLSARAAGHVAPGGSDGSSQQHPCLPIDLLGGDQLDFAGVDLRCPLTSLLEPQAVELFR